MATIEFTEYWCPTTEAWVLNPGPCPDGTEHTESREVKIVDTAFLGQD